MLDERSANANEKVSGGGNRTPEPSRTPNICLLCSKRVLFYITFPSLSLIPEDPGLDIITPLYPVVQAMYHAKWKHQHIMQQ
jgi:hypothetical protein